ncbi:formyltransferase family protein [Sporomusa sp.]|uniref:formyltransferase family protein n=1 Tax=Sporomusa sp. TaxID=2078658 RepID=UPI002CDA5E3F|nr:formyltransferase family protein [Sporomusa sp.]HWR45769.1 formyltransferase family protein [Sporomusa sp.]
MKISVVVDSPDSWFVEHGKRLCEILRKDHDVEFCTSLDKRKGDIAFLLSCGQIVTAKQLELHKSNIVIHAGDLPKEKGWSPMAWRILSGENEVILTLFEAAERVDSGKIYMKDKIVFRGDELLPELRERLTEKILAMAVKYVQLYPMIGLEQEGEDTFYRLRTPQDSELDINKSINEQFNLMRIADNESYPLFFWKDNIKYVLKIDKA